MAKRESAPAWGDHVFAVLRSEIGYQGRAFSVRQDVVQFPGEREARLDIVEHNGAVTIFPLDVRQRVWFVRQYRHAAAQALLELPAGTLEKGEDPLVCAQRELQEEIGMRAGELLPLGEFFLAPGYSTEYMHVFLARDLSPSTLPGDEDEFLVVEQIPLPQVLTMARSGHIQDAKTLAALFLALPYVDE